MVRIAIPDAEFPDEERPTLPGWEALISDYFTPDNAAATYSYDFGDGWMHAVTLREILDRDPRMAYPRCTGGGRACPPEDCGGPWGYPDFLQAISDPDHEEHESMLEWTGGGRSRCWA